MSLLFKVYQKFNRKKPTPLASKTTSQNIARHQRHDGMVMAGAHKQPGNTLDNPIDLDDPQYLASGLSSKVVDST